MPDTNELSDVIGIKFMRDSDDAPFMRFFAIVQAEAERQFGRVFFLDTCEGNDFIADDIDCADLSGWLIDREDADAFQQLRASGESQIPDRFERWSTMAEWSGDPRNPVISFSFPLGEVA